MTWKRLIRAWHWKRKWKRRLALVIYNHPRATEHQKDKARVVFNALLSSPRDGLTMVDGIIDCPRCGRSVECMAAPCEWTHMNDQTTPAWCRGLYEVTDYWGGIGECCGLLLVFQPDGRAECYELEGSA